MKKKRCIKGKVLAAFAAFIVVSNALLFSVSAEQTELDIRTVESTQASNQAFVEPFNKTDFTEGEYFTDGSRDIYISGGGRHRPAIHCDKVVVSGGYASAFITLDSPTFGYVSLEDDLDSIIAEHKTDVSAADLKIKSVHLDDKTSTFVVPVKLNEDFEFIAWSDNVNSWISPYHIRIDLTSDYTTVRTVDENGREISASYSVNVKNTGYPVDVSGTGLTTVRGVEYTVEASAGEYEGSTDFISSGNNTITIVLKKKNVYSDAVAKDDRQSPETQQNDNSKDIKASEDAGYEGKNQQTVTPSVETDDIINDGTYTVMYKDADSVRFNIKKVVLKAKKGAYTADVTLNGTGYGYVYPGSNAMAIAAPQSNWSPAWINGDGKYTYTITVPYLDKPFTLASRSVRDGIWYDNDHEMIIYSRKSDGSPLPTHKGVRDTAQQPVSGSGVSVAVLDNSSMSIRNASAGSLASSMSSAPTVAVSAPATSVIDSSTGLADGIYTPDAFSWSGGSGHINITCDRVIVKGGKTYARITISSAYYQYVKSGGQTITDVVHGPSSSTFVIPVELNKNNRIAALTTKLSQPYEIGYSIYVGLNAAKKAGNINLGSETSVSEGTSAATAAFADDVSRSADDVKEEDMIAVDEQYDKLDEKIPDITGLDFVSEITPEYSDLFKIFNYEDDYTLIEVNVNKRTGLDPEVLEEKGVDIEAEKKAEEEERKKKEEEKKDTNEEDGESQSETIEEQKSSLYKNNILKYLLIPEDGEVPAGLDKQLIIIKKPVDKTALTAISAFEYIDKLGITDKVTSVGIEEDKVKDIESDIFRKKVEELIKDSKKINSKTVERNDENSTKSNSIKDSETDVIKTKDEEDDIDENESLELIGTFDKISYKKLIERKNNLLIEDARILPQAESNEDEDKEDKEVKKDEAEGHKKYIDAKEKAEIFYKLGKFAMQLDIGVFVDRSVDEKNDLAKAEWFKVFGTIYGKEKDSVDLYKRIVNAASEEEIKEAKEAIQHSDET